MGRRGRGQGLPLGRDDRRRGEVLPSRRVENKEVDLLRLVGKALAYGLEPIWAVDRIDGGALLWEVREWPTCPVSQWIAPATTPTAASPRLLRRFWGSSLWLRSSPTGRKRQCRTPCDGRLGTTRGIRPSPMLRRWCARNRGRGRLLRITAGGRDGKRLARGHGTANQRGVLRGVNA